MFVSRSVLFAVFLALVIASTSVAYSQSASTSSGTSTRPYKVSGAFEVNIGQARFSSDNSPTSVDAIYADGGVLAYLHKRGMHIGLSRLIESKGQYPHETTYYEESFRIDMELVGSNPQPRVKFGEQAPGFVRFLTNTVDHRNSVALRYTSLTYHDVWPGIDMRSYTTSTGVKYDFIVHPGASPSQIAFVYKGGSLPWLTESGSLNLATPLGTIGERAPLTYQYVDGESTNTIIASRFKLDGYSIRFAIAEYDSSRPLIIDPQRVWATYYGGVPAGSGYRTSFGARTAIDSLGYAYFSGTTQAYNMPSSAGVLQKKHKAMLDGYVAKFDEFGKFIWHTYYGGSANDQIIDITIAPDNSVWVCGTTSSDDLPYLGAGSGPYGDADSNEVNEATVLKLTPDGAWADSWQIYGTQVDYAVSIAVSKDRVAVAGFTRSPKVGSHFGYPYTKNLETWSFGTQYDMFLCVTKPQSNNPARWVHEYVTFYGSEGNDLATKVAIDQRGNYLISGFSNSQGNITTDGSTPQGNDDALLVKFSNTMVRLWATRFGTNEIDQINDVAIDSKNNIIAGGYTEGLTFPVFNAFLSTRSGLFTNRQPEGFIRKWDELGTLLFSTYYGGDSGDAVNAVTVDMSDRIWLVGKTLYSTTIPVTPDAFQKVPQPKTGFDGFIGQLSADGQTVLFGSYYGAKSHYLIPPEVADYPNLDPGVDELTDIAVQKNAYISLSTQARSYRMPWTDGAFQDSFAVRTDTVRDNAFFTYVTTCPDSTITITTNGRETLCESEQRQLIAPLGFDRYRWSTGATTRFISVADSGVYFVVCTTRDGCRYRDTIIIRRSPKPTVNAGGDVVSCLNAPVTLTATPFSGTAPYRYKWNRVESGPEFIDNDTLQSPSVSPGATSRYEVTVTDAAGCVGKDTVIVTITDPKPKTSPALVDFGTLDACATAAEQEIIIANPMDYDIHISAFTPDNANVSLVTSLVPPIQIPAGELTRLRVRIAPTAAGTINGSFTLSGTPCAWSVAIPYKAVKQQLTATVIPGTISFGAGVICQQTLKTDSTTIRNGGQDVLVLQPGIVSTPFVIVSPTTSVSINPGEEKRVVFQYSPFGAGTFATVAKFPFTSGSCSDTLRVNLNAITSEVTVAATPSSIDMGILSGCEIERDTTITINNTSGVSVIVSLPSTAELIFSPAGPLTIAARSTQNVNVTIRPAATGAFSQTATLIAEPCTVSVPVTFTTQKNGIAFTTPASVDFGEFSVCETFPSTSRSSQLSFDGTGVATIAGVSAGSTISTTLTIGQVLTSGQPVPFNVVWTPSADGPLVDSIVIDLEPCSERRVIRLSGSRTSPRVSADVPSVDLGSIPGFSSGTVSFTNSGTDTLNVSIMSRSVNTVITGTRPENLTSIIPGARIEVDYRVNCAQRTTVLDTIEVSIPLACASSAFTALGGTCTSSATSAQSHIVIDTASVKIGDRFSVPIRIATSQGLNASNLRAWTANVTYNPMVVVGAGGSTPDCFVNGQFTPCTIALSGTRGADTVGQIAELTFTAVLGTTDMTMLTLSNFEWTADTNADISTTDGKVVITDICREGGDRYLAPKLEGFSITVFPTPASTDLTVLVKGAGRAPIPWSLANYIGVEVLNGTITPDASGTGQTVVDVRSLGAGLYLLTTDARGTTYRNTVLIQR